MLDRKEYEMVQALDMPTNVFVGVNKDIIASKETVEECGLRLHHKLTNLVRTFAKDNPSCVIEGRYSRYQNTRGVDTLRFYFKNEEAGTINITGKGKYSLSSKIIRQHLERGSYRETSNEAKAFKMMKATFIPEPIGEKFSTAVAQINNAVTRTYSDANDNYWDSFRRLARYMDKYVLERWEEASHAALLAGADPHMVRRFRDTIEPRDTIHKMYSKVSNNHGIVVYLCDGAYHISNPNLNPSGLPTSPTKQITYTNSDEVPDFIRRAVGLLKLVDDGTVMDGVGMRVSENKFFVSAENES